MAMSYGQKWHALAFSLVGAGFFLEKRYSEFEDKFLLRAQSYRRTWHCWQTQQKRWFRACSKGTLHFLFAGTQQFVCVTTPKTRWRVSSPWAGLWLASRKCLHMTQSQLQATEWGSFNKKFSDKCDPVHALNDCAWWITGRLKQTLIRLSCTAVLNDRIASAPKEGRNSEMGLQRAKVADWSGQIWN